MRELKYRAWDVNNRQMFYGVERPSYIDLYDCVQTFDFFLDNEAVELMQFTGMKDKNGKEIYEGDILIDLMISPSLNNKIVIRNYIEDSYHIINEMREGCHFEIIGNIYENPEMIP